jgi:type I restriction enzyme S subunit
LSCTEKHYIKKLINSNYFLKYAFSSATGTTIKNVSLKSMRELCVPLPPLQEQHRIVTKVDELLTLCEQLKTKLATAQTLQQQLAETLVQKAVA